MRLLPEQKCSGFII